ncbi:MAG: hypothetical protein JXA91_03630 [Candidatus Thermoplasmatota archaeon]|nr:hypothetical protein [Candidatus Thermoplasmatota archaeon]
MKSKKGFIILVIGAFVIGMAMCVSADEERQEIQITSVEAEENQEDWLIAPTPDEYLDDTSNGESEDILISPTPENEELIIAPNPAENDDYDVYILDGNNKAEGCASGEIFSTGLQSIGLLGVIGALVCIVLVRSRKKID